MDPPLPYDELIDTGYREDGEGCWIPPGDDDEPEAEAFALLEKPAPTRQPTRTLARPTEVPWDQPVPISREAALPAFPVQLLPSWAADYVEALAIATQTPADLAGMLVLGALSAACGGRAKVEPRLGWTEPTNLYVAVGMEPGNRKTPVFTAVAEPLWSVDRELAEKSLPELIEAEARKNVARAAADAAAREAAKAKGHEAETKLAEALAAAEAAEAVTLPAQPRLLADDATPEALASLMSSQGGRLAVLSDEGGVFDLMAGRYSNSAPNLDLYLKAWSGSPHRVDRKGRPSEFIPRPALTMALAVQPDVLRALGRRPGFRGRGLLGRFLYSLPESPLGRRLIDPPPVPEDVGFAYRVSLEALVRSLADWTDEALLGFTPEADELLRGFETRLEPRLDPVADLAHVADWAAKLAGQLVRIAALIHLGTHLRDGWRKAVDARSVAGAIEFGDYLIAHALAVFDLMGHDQITDDAVYVLKWLAAHGRDTFIARDLYTANRTRFPTADSVEPALSHLDSFGWIRRQASPPPTGRGRPPSQVWAVHPMAHQRNQHK
jgi:hypothetical protein